jgi:hypothetical protein
MSTGGDIFGVMPVSPPPSPGDGAGDAVISPPPSPPPEPNDDVVMVDEPATAAPSLTDASSTSRIITAPWLLDRLGPSRRWGGDGLSRLMGLACLEKLREEWPKLDEVGGAKSRSRVAAVAATRARALLCLLTPSASAGPAAAEARALISDALVLSSKPPDFSSLAAGGSDDGSLRSAYSAAQELVVLSAALVMQLRPSLVPEGSEAVSAQAALKSAIRSVVARTRDRLRLAEDAGAGGGSSEPSGDGIVQDDENMCRGFMRALRLGAVGAFGGTDAKSDPPPLEVRGLSLDSLPLEARLCSLPAELSAALLCGPTRRDFRLNINARNAEMARAHMIHKGVAALEETTLASVGVALDPSSTSAEDLEAALDAISNILHPDLSASIAAARAVTVINVLGTSTSSHGQQRFPLAEARAAPSKRHRDTSSLMLGDDEADAEKAAPARAPAPAEKAQAPAAANPTLLDLLTDAPLLNEKDRATIVAFAAGANRPESHPAVLAGGEPSASAPPTLATFLLREFIPPARGGAVGIGGGSAAVKISLSRVFVELDYANQKWRAYRKKA